LAVRAKVGHVGINFVAHGKKLCSVVRQHRWV